MKEGSRFQVSGFRCESRVVGKGAWWERSPLRLAPLGTSPQFRSLRSPGGRHRVLRRTNNEERGTRNEERVTTNYLLTAIRSHTAEAPRINRAVARETMSR
jgi:hypothetical protein